MKQELKLLKTRCNITVPILGLFLITGSIGYGIEVSEDFINEEAIVNKSGNGVDITENGLSITNSGIIKGDSIELDYAGNGIASFDFNSIKQIINTGTIRGKSIGSGAAGNGISFYDTHNSGDHTIENIDNTGIIEGNASLEGRRYNTHAGNGIYSNRNSNNEIKKISNFGIISGFAKEGRWFSGNGIANYANGDQATINNIYNRGLIKGEAKDKPTGMVNSIGNGIINYTDNAQGISIVEKISNFGIISGFFEASNTQYENFTGNGIVSWANKVATGDIINNGVISGYSVVSYENGIGILSTNSSNNATNRMINNTGLIKGSHQAVKGNFSSFENNGILAGQIITDSPYTNNGIAITLDNTGNIDSIVNGHGGVIEGKTILNGEINIGGNDSSISSSSLTKGTNYIVNGAGVGKGALIVDENTELTNSIINGYNTAVYMESEKTLTATDTTFNGGGLKNDVAVIDIKGNNASATINGTSIINGKTDVSGNNSTVSIGNEVMVNGDLTSNKDGNNTLNLGDGTSEELRLFHKVDGFTTINTSGNVTAYETAKISTGDIHIKDGNFVVRVDGTELDSKGRVKGHALYEHKGDIIIEVPTADTPMTYAQNHQGAQLVFKASGLGVGTVIAMEGTDITNLYDPQIGTYSIAHTAVKHLDENGNLTGDVEIALVNFDDIFIPENPDQPERDENNEELEDIYDSIVKGDQLPSLAPTIDTENKTEEEARKGLLTLLDQVYANNPYVQSSKMSKENMDLFREEIFSTKMPKKNEWIIEGHGVYSIDRYEKNRRISIDETSVSNKYSNEMITRGLLGTGEYGVDHNMSIGFGMGGSHQKLDMSKGSSLKGDAIYLGVFGKKKVNNYIFTAGLGYQHGKYDGNRILTNQYQTIRNTGDIKTEAWDIYGEMKYVIENSDGRRLEPKVRFSQSFIDQKSLSEKNGALAIDMKDKRYLVPEIEIGMDLIEPIKVKSGKLEFKYGIGLAKTFGKNSNYTTAKIKDSTEFKVLGPDFNDTKLRLNGGLDYENSKGIFYNVALGVDITKDTKENINATIGIGYKF